MIKHFIISENYKDLNDNELLDFQNGIKIIFSKLVKLTFNIQLVVVKNLRYIHYFVQFKKVFFQNVE